jgi:hypothetical protein
MDQPQWFVHMDERWMWRWYITDAYGKPFAISKANFFRREDALRNLKAARVALSG